MSKRELRICFFLTYEKLTFASSSLISVVKIYINPSCLEIQELVNQKSKSYLTGQIRRMFFSETFFSFITALTVLIGFTCWIYNYNCLLGKTLQRTSVTTTTTTTTSEAPNQPTNQRA